MSMVLNFSCPMYRFAADGSCCRFFTGNSDAFFSAGLVVLTPYRLSLAAAVALLVGWLLGRRERVPVEPALTRMLLCVLISARF